MHVLCRAIRNRELSGVTDHRVSYFPRHLKEMRFLGMYALLAGALRFPAPRQVRTCWIPRPK